jgi:WD40 repeat protein
VCAGPALPSTAAIERWVGQLGSKEYAEREGATRALEAAGERALPALAKKSRDPDLEVRLRARRVAKAIISRRDRQIATLRAGGWVDSVAVSSDGRYALVGVTRSTEGGKQSTSSAEVWDLGGGRTLRRWSVKPQACGQMPGLVLSPDGRLAACVYWSEGIVWDIRSGEPLRRLGGPFPEVLGQHNVTFLDNRYLHAGAAVLDLRTGRAVAAVKVEGGSFATMAFSPDRRRAVVGKTRRTERHCMAFGRVARLMPRTEGWVEVVDVASGKKGWSLAPDSKCVERVAFPPPGNRVVFAYSDGSVRVWDVVKDREPRRVETGSRCGAIAPDGRRVLCLPGDGSLSLWDIESGKELRRYRGHEGQIRCAAFSADGRLAVSGGKDGTVCVWRLPP